MRGMRGMRGRVRRPYVRGPVFRPRPIFRAWRPAYARWRRPWAWGMGCLLSVLGMLGLLDLMVLGSIVR